MRKRNLFFIAFFLIFATHSLSAQETDSLSYYKSIYYKGTALIEFNEQIHNCQFNFVNVVDSFLYIQFNVIGIEMCRVFATPDIVVIINKLEKTFYYGDYFILQTVTGIDFDFYMLQNIFNGVSDTLPFGFDVSYSGELSVDEYTFFKTLYCEHEMFSLKMDIKKVTFDDVPAVTAVIPRNFTPMF